MAMQISTAQPCGVEMIHVSGDDRWYLIVDGGHRHDVRVDIGGWPTDGTSYRTIIVPRSELRPDWDRPVPAACAGTWLAGNMGWHNSYRVVHLAEDYGFTVPPEYAADWNAFEQALTADDAADPNLWALASGDDGSLSALATDYLSERLPDGYVLRWDMGELTMLQAWEDCAADGNGCTEEQRCPDHAAEVTE